MTPRIGSRPLLAAAMAFAGCAAAPHDDAQDATFADDVAFLRQHVETVVLTSPTGARLAVVPAWQGRVMTSTTGGKRAPSFGWLHRARIAQGGYTPHIQVFGGEDRFWLGPEGGPHSLFFAKGAPWTLDAWQTPPAIDREPYAVTSRSSTHVAFAHEATLTTRSGTQLPLRIARAVHLLPPQDALAPLGVELAPGVEAVSFESVNMVTNTGAAAWQKDTGMPSIWILGMFAATPASRVLVPFVGGPERYHGPVVNDAYFGAIPKDRLFVDDARSLLVFRGDAGMRGKLGVGPQRAKRVLGSWDGERGVLTIVEYTLPVDAKDYVNSLWRDDVDPYAGDVVNSYNDGPAPDGGPGLGAFFELETSSPALALPPGETATHVHRTTHLVGDRAQLAAIAKAVLGADLDALPW
jgi:hypothetical protein